MTVDEARALANAIARFQIIAVGALDTNDVALTLESALDRAEDDIALTRNIERGPRPS